MGPLDPVTIIRALGYVGVAAIVFAESGLLIGFFLPGDSLLFTAGFLASQGILNIWALAPLCFIAAVAGDAVGYSFGRRMGRQLFIRPNSRWFRHEHLIRAEEFFERHGGKAIMLARFIPIVRTFTPIVAGAAVMPYRRFAVFNALGGLFWAIGVTLTGYFLGNVIPDIDRYLLPAVILIIAVSIAPAALHILRERSQNTRKLREADRAWADD